MNILITGGCGFIGSHLSELCLAQGHRVTIIDNLSTGQISNIATIESNERLKFYEDSIFNIELLTKLISENDVIIHLAAAVGVQLIVSQPVETIETNVFGTHHVIRLANQFRKRLLIASTSEIYGKNTNTPFSEDSDRVLGPTSISRWSYSSSKAIDEFLGLAYHKQFGLDVVIFRLFNTVGPKQTGRYGMVLPNFVSKAIAKEKLIIHGDGSQSRCFCDVKDVTKAILKLSEQKETSGQIFNIGSSEEITINDLALKVINIVKQKQNKLIHVKKSDLHKYVTYMTYEEAFGQGFEDMLKRKPNTDKISELIGWEASINLDTTIERIVDYFFGK
mgnify:CR=1 FL=1